MVTEPYQFQRNRPTVEPHLDDLTPAAHSLNAVVGSRAHPRTFEGRIDASTAGDFQNALQGVFGIDPDHRLGTQSLGQNEPIRIL